MDDLIGYARPWIAAPGERVALATSGAEGTTIGGEVVWLRHGWEAGPGVIEEPVARLEPWTGHVQDSGAGSFAVAGPLAPLAGADAARIELWLLPTLLGDAEQCVCSLRDEQAAIELALADDGALTLRVRRDGATVAACSVGVPTKGAWHRIVVDVDQSEARLTCEPRESWLGRPRREANSALPKPVSFKSAPSLWLAAAGARPRPDGTLGIPSDPFTGKIAAPCVRTGAGELVAEWDLTRELHSDHLVDVGPHGAHGRAYNAPTRGVTAHDWREGTTLAEGTTGYNAIHFHRGDVEDVGWVADAHIEVGADWKSGFYAARITTEDGRIDRIPFIVSAAGRPRARIAYLAPTFTYLAYANIRSVIRLIPGAVEREPRYGLLDRHPGWGSSLYDSHADGSGVVHSSSLRPIVDLRPDFKFAITGAPRHLGLDLALIDWLEHHGYEYDVITDNDLDREGAALLEPYDAVLTGSHPEYVSGRELDALEAHLARGGGLAYLGGNGFYWVTSVVPGREHLIELRRGMAGGRAWESAPGETCHSSTGELGGLWRHRGRSPNALTGVGFAAQGWDDRAPGYERTAGSRDPRAAFLFEGVEEERFGERSLPGGGAAGDEVDRYDPRFGSPAEAVVVATSTGHSAEYMLTHEDVLMTVPGLGGDVNPDVRSDMVWTEAPSGGMVFSASAINWIGSLCDERYESATSRILRNVLARFLRRDGAA